MKISIENLENDIHQKKKHQNGSSENGENGVAKMSMAASSAGKKQYQSGEENHQQMKAAAQSLIYSVKHVALYEK